MKAKIIAGSCLAGALVCAPVSADILGIYIKAGAWNQNPSGGFGDPGSLVDLENDLGMDSTTGGMFSIAFEHPIPLIPNIKAEHTDLSFTNQSTLTQGIVFDGTVYPAGENISSDIDFSHTDFIIYYEILDNWVSLDVGLNIKLFDGTLSIDGDTAGKSEVELDVPVPMLYGKVQFDLPFTGLSVGGEGSYLGYDGDSFTDIRAFVAYELSFGLGFEVGARSIDMQVDEFEDVVVDTTFDGAYVSMTLHI